MIVRRLPQGQPPHGIVVLHALLVKLLSKLLVVCEDSRQVPSQRDPVRSSQRRHVEDEVRLLAFRRQRQAVRKNESSLCVRVPNLHGQATPALDHVAWPEGVSSDTVLHTRYENSELDVELGRHDHGGEGQHGSCSSHVLLHGDHVGRL